MSRYDSLSTDQLKTSLQAMGSFARQYGETGWQVGQDQMHDEINQVLDELDERSGQQN